MKKKEKNWMKLFFMKNLVEKQLSSELTTINQLTNLQDITHQT
jgi:hypothetical protein